MLELLLNPLKIDLKKKVENYKPNLIALSATEDMWELGVQILEEIRDHLLGIDINNLTPVEALMKLNDIKRKIGLGK